MTPLHRIRDAADLARWLGLPVEHLEAVLELGDRGYHRYFSRSLERPIDEPCPELMVVQRTLLKKAGPFAKAHRAAHGGVLGRSTLTNVKVHYPARSVSKVDIKRFFPSVTAGMVRSAFAAFTLDKGLVDLLVRLTTHSEGLPTGSPTSPWVGNLVLRGVDRHLGRFCMPRGIRYTRYIDDLTFSGRRCREAYDQATYMLSRMGLTCSTKKCVPFTDTQRAIVVTGYIINQERIKPPRAYRRRVRALVETLITAQRDGQPIERTELAVVRGHLAYLQETCPEEANSYEADLFKAGFPLTSELLPAFFYM